MPANELHQVYRKAYLLTGKKDLIEVLINNVC